MVYLDVANDWTISAGGGGTAVSLVSWCAWAALGNTELCVLTSDRQLQRAWQIGRAVELAARFTPWESSVWCKL